MGSSSTLQEKYSKILIKNGILDPILSVTETQSTDLVGQHMCSKIIYTIIKFQNGTKDDLHLFVKGPVGSANKEQEEQFARLMEKEVGFFGSCLPEMKDFCTHKCGVNNLMSSITPRIFHADKTGIIMENLSKQGYVMLDRTDRHDVKQAKLVLEALAELHAVSNQFIGQSVSKDSFLAANPHLQDIIEFPGVTEMFGQMFEPTIAIVLDMLKESSKPGAKNAIHRLEPFAGNACKIYVKIFEGPNLVDVINHGDCWNNNIMFSKDQDQVVLLDFQVTRVSAPSLDLTYYIFSSTRQEVKRDWKGLLKIYHDRFTQVIKELNGSVNFTFEDLCKEFRAKVELGLFIGVIFAVGSEAIRTYDSENSESLEENIFEKISVLVKQYIAENPEKVNFIVEEIIDVVNLFDEIKEGA